MNASDYARVEKAIRFVEQHFREQPSLAEIAASTGLSPHHFQRLFRRWVGVTPKRFLQYLTADYAAVLLRASQSVLDASLAAGLSSPGRLHDLLVTVHAVTPGELKRMGKGTTIRYGSHPSPFGQCLLAITERGVCGLSFVEGSDRKTAITELGERWPHAELCEDSARTGHVAGRIFATCRDRGHGPINLLVHGTNFQVKVWEALLRVPAGSLLSYGDLAQEVGRPGAARAVGTALAQNPIAYLIPCHRVIPKAGGLGGYRWGDTRKRAMLAWEAAQSYGHAPLRPGLTD